MARKLSDFIHDELNSTQNGPCVMFALVYPKEAEREVHTIRLTGESAPTPEEIARVFTDIAETDAQHYEAVSVAYSVLSFFKTTGNVPVHRFPIRVKGHSEFGLSGNSEPEGPTDTGERMQRMRHKEDVHEAVIRMAGVTFNSLGSLINEMRTELRDKSHENVEMFGLLKDVLMQRALDNHDMRMKELAFERTSMEIKKLWDSAPAALRMLGMPIPESTVSTNVLEMFVDGISEDQSAKLFELISSFPAEKQMLIMDYFHKTQEKINREREAKKKALKKADAEITTSQVIKNGEVHANGTNGKS